MGFGISKSSPGRYSESKPPLDEDATAEEKFHNSATPVKIVKAKTVAIEDFATEQGTAKGERDTVETATGEWRDNAHGFGKGRAGDGRSTECINPGLPVQYRGGKPPYGLTSRSINKLPLLPPSKKEVEQARRAAKKRRKSVRTTQKAMEHLRQCDERYWTDEVYRARVEASWEASSIAHLIKIGYALQPLPAERERAFTPRKYNPNRKTGRKPIFGKRMTDAERQRRSRAQRKK
jgi:hypothetical protein